MDCRISKKIILKPANVLLVVILFVFSSFFLKELEAKENPVLVKSNRSTGCIVIPSSAIKEEIFAAEELQLYVKKISGVELQILRSDDIPDKPTVIIGRHPASRDIINEMDRRFPNNYDRIAVVGKGNHLYLVGHSPSGTVWAVWDWLESLGVRWLLPTERGEYTPKVNAISIPQSSKYDAPALLFRGPNYKMSQKHGAPSDVLKKEHGFEASAMFSYRMRLNNYINISMSDNWTNIGSGHSYAKFLPPSRYYDDHPEWFNLINGRRLNKHHSCQVCFTNQLAAKEFARNIVTNAKQAMDTYNIPVEHLRLFVSPNDRKAICECENCAKLVDKDGSSSSLVLHFANLVAEEIRKTYPAAKIVYYVYANYGNIPDHTKPSPGVYPEIVFWTLGSGTAANHAHPMFSEANRKYKKVFNWFAQYSEGLSAHTYYGHYNWFTPWPKITQMATDIKVMAKEKNFYGMYSESHLHWGTQGLNLYMHPKLMWNPDLDVEQAIDDYCQKAFGPAAAFMRDYFDILQAAMDSKNHIGGNLVELPSFLTPQIIINCDKSIDSAESVLDQMDSNTRWRTNLYIQAWRASAKFVKAMRLYINPTSKNSRNEILTLLEEVEAFASTDLGLWSFETRMVAGGINPLLNKLRLDLNNLTVGSHVFNDRFGYGGAVKFFGNVTGLTRGIWGYSLPASGQGSLELPLRTVPGGRISSVKVVFDFAFPEKVDVKLTALSDDGERVTLTTSVEQLHEGLILPDSFLGDQEVCLALTLKNLDDNPQIVLTGMQLNITVE